MSNKNSNRLLLLILMIFTWFVGAILYLVFIKPKGIEFILVILAIFIPFIPGIILLLNALDIIKLEK